MRVDCYVFLTRAEHAVPLAQAVGNRLRVPAQRLAGSDGEVVVRVTLLDAHGALADAAAEVEREVVRYVTERPELRGSRVTRVDVEAGT